MTSPDVPPVASLTLLGGFELSMQGSVVAVPHGAQRLLAYLALSDRFVLRVRIAGMLWFDATEEHAFANLRSTLWRLRRCGDGLVEAAGPKLLLGPAVDVDIRTATDVAHRLLYGPPDDEILNFDPRALAAELLPDWYEDWVLLEREQFRQLRLHALDALCERLISTGRLAQAMETGLAALVADPLRESAHRALIVIHLAERNKGEALRQYRLYRRLLVDKLGLEPSERIEELVRGLRGTGAGWVT